MGDHTNAPNQEFAARLADVRERMAAIGRPGARIVAVTKGFGIETVRMARNAGLDDIGESYAQEMQAKFEQRSDSGEEVGGGPEEAATEGARLHFIGRIQRNKVRKLTHLVDFWHSVARTETLDEIAKRTERATVLIQVNVADDPTKAGVDEADLESVLARASELGVTVAGLMTIGVQDDAAATRAAFVEIDRLAAVHELPERSMGMSNDFEDALEAGATMIRLGTALFGPRTETR